MKQAQLQLNFFLIIPITSMGKSKPSFSLQNKIDNTTKLYGLLIKNFLKDAAYWRI